MSRPSRRALSIALLVALGAGLYLPSVAVPAFHGEEARRAIPAREMLASGDFVLPTIWGRPYLNKPPLQFWLVAGVAAARGSADELSTRLPSVIATLATALVVYAFGISLLGEGAGLAAALLFLLSLNVLGKGALGEIEPPFAFAVFASAALLWRGREGSWPALLGSGLLLGAALLLKGPAALLFQLGAGLGIAACGGGWRFLRSARFWVPTLLGVLPLLVWAVALLEQLDSEELLPLWLGEITRTGGHSDPARYWTDRLGFAAGALGALLPSSLLCALALRSDAGRAWLRGPGARFAGVVVATSLAYFLIAPGARPRYVYPAVPFACLAAADFVVRAFRDGDRVALRRLAACSGLVLAGGLLAGLVAALPPLRGATGLAPLGAPGALWLLALAGISLLGLRQLSRGATRAGAIAALAVLALGRLFQLVELAPQLDAGRAGVAQMRALERTLPPGRSVGLNVAAMWNELVYLRRPLRWVEDPAAVAAGDVLLLDGRARGEFAAALELEELHREQIRSHRELSALRVLGAKPATAYGP